MFTQNTRLIMVCGILFMALVAPSLSFGAGIEVGPSIIVLQNVPLGKRIAFSGLTGESMKLSIKNKGESSCVYTINILPTTQTTIALEKEYLDIPDISWISSESKEVRISGYSTKVVELYIQVPKKKEYSDKKYQAVIEVKSKKNSPEDFFVLACQLKLYFSTAAGGKHEKK